MSESIRGGGRMRRWMESNREEKWRRKIEKEEQNL